MGENGSAGKLVVDGLGFAESLRWRDGELWFSDFRSRKVVSIDANGRAHLRAFVPCQPSGLGWTTDGTLLVSSMIDQNLISITDTGRSVVASLDGYAVGPINDMLVDRQGRAYIGSHGGDVVYGTPDINNPTELLKPADLIMVSPDGTVTVAAEGLSLANGMAMSQDGDLLLVVESLKGRILAFDVDGDGVLSNQRVFADVGGLPDGMCIDSAGDAWVAIMAPEPKLLHVRDGGEVLDEIPTPGRMSIDCVLGGEDGRTLFGSVVTSELNVWSDGETVCHIESWQVDVPGVV